MKAVLISIKPKYCELIANGKKTVEVRKTMPKLELPFKCYIYCTANKNGAYDLLEIHNADGKIHKANSKVIGEFVCDRITEIHYHDWSGDYGVPMELYFANIFAESTCLNYDELDKYLQEKDGYGWNITDLVIYDKPKELWEFKPLTCEYNADNECIKKSKCKHQETTMCWGYITNRCNKQITRPPQSWCYVEKLGV